MHIISAVQNRAHIFNCSIIKPTSDCSNTIIDCPSNQDCLIDCSGANACLNSIINCPRSLDCTIWCFGDSSCKDVIVNATFTQTVSVTTMGYHSGPNIYCPNLNTHNASIYYGCYLEGFGNRTQYIDTNWYVEGGDFDISIECWDSPQRNCARNVTLFSGSKYNESCIVGNSTNNSTCLSVEYNSTTSVSNSMISAADDTTTFYVIIISGLSAFIILILLLMCCKFRYNTLERKSKTTFIKSPMVIAVAIGEYEENASSHFDGYFQDLCGIDQDIKNVHHLFNTVLNYEIFPKYDITKHIKQHWTLAELKQFFDKRAGELESNTDKYDALIVIISCHGIRDYVVTSDYKLFEKIAIHRIFTAHRPLTRRIPRMFLFDCCDGSSERQSALRKSIHESDLEDEVVKALSSDMNEGNDKSSIYRESKVISLASIQGENDEIWLRNEENPDYRLITVHAANIGFQSKMSIETGSYVITGFTRAMITNIQQQNNKKFLFEILDDIQNELHSKGKQQTVNTFNNNTRYIKFLRKNNEITKNVTNNAEAMMVEIQTSMSSSSKNEDHIEMP